MQQATSVWAIRSAP